MNLPSPLQTVNYRNFLFDIKRDDLIDPHVSGNKWRKLKYVIEDVKRLKKTQLVTFGGAYSNHLVATAAVAAHNQLCATAFVRGEAVKNSMLDICQHYGMRLLFVPRDEYRNKSALFMRYFGNDDSAYFIDEGGAGGLATLGCAEIIDELPNVYDHIFCAAGTGTTVAGLLKGITEKSLHTKLHAVPVLKNGGFIKEEIAKYTIIDDRLELHLDYHFGGYAKYNQILLDFLTDFTHITGVKVDQVYTAKMCYAAMQLLGTGKIPANDKILLLHTGGLLGLTGIQHLLP